MTLLAVFAGVALILAAIGIFGVLSYAVAQRTREIGIRMALGAQEGTVRRLVVREAMLLAGLGVAIGMVCALFLSRALVASLLFSTSPQDPVTFAVAAAVLTLVAFASSHIPARRVSIRSSRSAPTEAAAYSHRLRPRITATDGGRGLRRKTAAADYSHRLRPRITRSTRMHVYTGSVLTVVPPLARAAGP